MSGIDRRAAGEAARSVSRGGRGDKLVAGGAAVLLGGLGASACTTDPSTHESPWIDPPPAVGQPFPDVQQPPAVSGDGTPFNCTGIQWEWLPDGSGILVRLRDSNGNFATGQEKGIFTLSVGLGLGHTGLTGVAAEGGVLEAPPIEEVTFLFGTHDLPDGLVPQPDGSFATETATNREDLAAQYGFPGFSVPEGCFVAVYPR